MFVGYPPGVNGYKLYDILSKSFFISRDVVYHDHLSPFHSILHPNDSVDPFPNIVLPKPAQDIGSTFKSIRDVQNTCVNCTNYQSSKNSNSSLQLSPIRTTRTVKPLSYLRDCHCNLLTNSHPLSNKTTPYPLSKYLSHKSFSPAHCAYLLNVSSNIEPQFYQVTVKYSHWREAMANELDAMGLNHTWSVVNLPKGKHSIGCKQVYKIKYKSNRSIDRYKAR